MADEERELTRATSIYRRERSKATDVLELLFGLFLLYLIVLSIGDFIVGGRPTRPERRWQRRR